MSLSIPDEKISEIKNAADIVDVVSEVVLLKKTGQNHSGLCPFHSEKTPSFSVSPNKQIFYCFGCGIGGDVFDFVQKYENVSFPEAVRALARRFGIDIPERSMSPQQRAQISERERLYKINADAMVFFQQSLRNRAGENTALTYLTNRGLNREIMDTFGLGYAPPGWDKLVTYFKRKKVALSLVEKAGLIVAKKNAAGQPSRYYDRFRDRVMFPILDTRRQVIGFGGRVMDQSLPKYLNSPETAIYNKSKSLYGVFSAKRQCRELGVIFIVEGYMDLISLYQYGIQNVVATLGTSMTQEHVKIIKGHIGQTGKAILVYDSDQAGLKAAKRSIAIFDKERIDVFILELPQGHDPDTYVKAYGSEKFHALAEKAPSALVFLLKYLMKEHGTSIEGKAHVVSDMIEPLSLITDTVKQSLYVKMLSEHTGVNEAAIFERLLLFSSKSNALGKNRASISEQPKETGARYAVKKWDRMEKQVIAMMLNFPEILAKIDGNDVLQYFTDEQLKSIGQLVVTFYSESLKKDDGIDLPRLMARVESAEIKRAIASLAIISDAWDQQGCINLIQQFVSSRKRRENSLNEKIKAAENNNDQELLYELLKQKQIQAQKTRGKNLEFAGGHVL